MALGRIRITDLRCLAEVDVILHPRRSYLFGPNGAGKTSFLEALFLLGRGRSFRTRHIQRLVRRGTAGFTVYGELADAERLRRIGVACTAGSLEKRIDGSEAGGMAALAQVLRVHAIDPSIHALIEGGPSERRRFLDWGVFHVEHGYLEAWKRYRRAVSQRNAALKRRATNAELRTWDDALVAEGAVIDRQRRAYVARVASLVSAFGQQLLQESLTLIYRPGWPQDQTFESALAATAADERAAVTTEVGPHRADLLLHLGGQRVQDAASRGQQKLTAAALILGQVALAQAEESAEGLLLVDDPAAELDAHSLERLLAVITALPGQQVFTGLSRTTLPADANAAAFHVERGEVRAL